MTAFTSWIDTYPPGHEKEGQEVEVVPRELLAEAVERLNRVTSSEELEVVRERAASAVERACERLGCDDPVDEALCSQLRFEMLNLIQLATR